MVAGSNVSEAYRQHDVDGPVVRPDVALPYRSILYTFFSHPILPWTQMGNRPEEKCQNVGEAEVEEEDLDE